MGDLDSEVRVSESDDLVGASDNALFDASQYEFFGKDGVVEVELGGLEDGGEEADLVGLDDKDNQFYSFRDREEINMLHLQTEGLGSYSDIDDISSTFSKLNRTVSEPRGTGDADARGSFSREMFVNGLVCEDPKLAKADDFFFTGLDEPGNTSNLVGSAVTQVTAAQLPGLNTLGISMVRIDFEPRGVNPPHTHPRATEILTVVEGSLHVGFVTSNPDNRLFEKLLRKGDVFVFPQGLIHFQLNPAGDSNAVAMAALSSQNPGVITIANAVFGANPPISYDVLARAFQLDKKTLDRLQAQFS